MGSFRGAETHARSILKAVLADAGNARYVRDQLVPDGQAQVGGFDCGARVRHQNRVVLFSRARLVGGRLEPALITVVAGSNPTRP